MNAKSPPVGIDLGTTFSVVAYLDNTGRPQTVINSEGDVTTPSVVYFEDDLIVVGKEAVKAAPLEPEFVAQCAKRDMGQQTFHKAIKGHTYPPEVIQSMILKKLKGDVEAVLGPIDDVVITVPAFFNEPRRKATQDAGRLAGLNVRDIINEPTAAAIAYGVQKGFLDQSGAAKHSERVFIYDLGGGTFDVTVMEINGNDYRVLATDGNVKLGGVDWDQRIADLIAEQFVEKNNVDPREEPAGMQRLLRDAEEAKRALTARSKITVSFEHRGMGVRVPITRDQFNEITADLLERTRFTTVNLLRQVDMNWTDVTRLMLVGGSTRMPMVSEMLEQVSGQKVDRALSADEAVAHGAAIYAGLLRQDNRIAQHNLTVTNVNSHSLGVLGIEKKTGRKRNRVLIPANTPLPAKQSSRFSTHRAGQRSVAINVVEGGDASGYNSTPVGTCVISGLPASLPENTAVIVTFAYEANGRLKVRAKIPDLQKEAHLEIQRDSGMSDSNLKDWEQRLGVADADTANAKGGDEETLDLDAPTPSPATPAAVPELDHLREYRLLEKLADGGMGTVYKAEHTRLKKLVALKVLPTERMRDVRAVDRFQREMEAVGRLEHPNIVRAMDAGEVDGTHFLVMEFVSGVNLDALARGVAYFPLPDACELVRQAALGLQHAHEHGLVHRDLKPSNVMLTLSATVSSRQHVGVVKILDLGLALLRGQPTERMLTSAGQVIGTVDYMAPEQAADSNVDIRADIYSLGCTLYRLLAGRPPFGDRDTNLVQTMMAHAQRPVPPIHTIRDDVPSELTAILDRMLAKSPADRFATPIEVADALEPLARGHDLPALAEGRASQPATTSPKSGSGSGGSTPMPSESPSQATAAMFNASTHPERALQLYRQYELELTGQQYFTLAEHAANLRSDDEALQLFDEAERAAQRDKSIAGDVVVSKLVAFLTELGRTEEIGERLRQAVAAFPDNAELHLQLATALAASAADGELPAECLAHAARAVELRPDDVAALRLASRASWFAQDLTACLDYAQQLYGTSESPEDQLEACLTMGLVYMEDDESCESAIEAFEAALEIDPSSTDVMSYLADCYWRQERHDDAYQIAQRCLAIDPDDEFCTNVVREFEQATS